MLLKFGLGSDARSKQDCRAAVCAAGDDNLLSCVVDPGCTIGGLSCHARSVSFTRPLAEDDLVDCGISLDGNIPAVILVRDEISTCCAKTLIYCARHMATSLRDIPRAEHIVLKGHALGDVRV